VRVALTLLSQTHALLGRWPATRRLMRAMRVGYLGRVWLRRAVLPSELARSDDVTVVIAVRNRCDYRLVNALHSLRAQTHPAELVQIFVVDYGSEPASMRETAALCQTHDARHIWVDVAGVWSRARSMNIGVRLANTKYLLASDADTVFSPRYISDCIAAQKSSPLTVVCSPMLDLPQESAETFKNAANPGEDVDLVHWKKSCSPRFGWEWHSAITFTLTAFYQCIRGYDEFYTVWGLDDDDLMQRFTQLGLQVKVLDSESFYLHQWHPKFEGVPGGENNMFVGRNRAYQRRKHSIVRNDHEWGHHKGIGEH